MNLNTLPLIEWPKNTSEPDQWNQLSVLIKQLEPSQKLWLSGYLAASAESNMPNQIAQASVPAVESQLTILYGSQTGNSESVAIQLKETAEATGLQTELFSLADFTVKNLAKKSYITLVISTHGEGEAPDDAELFYEQLFSKKAPELTHLNYSVLALGDSSYELYCQTGKEIDDRLADLGATRFNDRIDCDVDFEAEANLWVNAVVKRLDSEFKERVSQDNITTLPLNNHLTTPTQIAISRKNPYAAEILNIQKITGHGSIKNTFHIELAIDPEIIQYQPGDSLGIIAQNHEHSVNQLLAHWQVSGDELYQFKGQSADLKTLLIEYVEISQISKPFVQFLAKHIDDSDLKSLATSHQLYEAFCHGNQLYDLLQKFDSSRSVSIQDTLDHLKQITPRLYSIASAQSVYEDEVHLTVNLEDATNSGALGLASGLLCEQAEVGDCVSIFIESNHNFRLPDDPQTNVIMIGPGTGIAPFRAFLQQRKQQQAAGENWLFFGNPHFSTDFLYQTEWLKLQKLNLLTGLDVAFSRDQVEKVYVQNKLLTKAQELWKWIENGAHLYLCGDANKMAKDVEQALLTIITEQGNLDTDAAKAYLKALKRANKYQKDVY